MFKRFGVLILVNFAVMFTLMLIINLLGVRGYITAQGVDYRALMVICFVYGMGGAFFSLLISKQMAKWMMGVQIIDVNNASGDQRRLFEMVARLAKVAGLPKTPEVGIYSSPEINAFATGPSRSNSLVAVSSGLLGAMDQNEIEGVLAHEITHVANGDMVTMTLIQGTMNAFVMFVSKALAWAIANGMRNQNSENDSRPNYFMVMMIEMVLYAVFGIFAGIVVSWFSRQREYAADKGGAAIAGTNKMVAALEKLKRVYEFNETVTATAGASHQDPVMNLKISGSKGFLALLRSHPALDDRIQRLRGL